MHNSAGVILAADFSEHEEKPCEEKIPAAAGEKSSCDRGI